VGAGAPIPDGPVLGGPGPIDPVTMPMGPPDATTTDLVPAGALIPGAVGLPSFEGAPEGWGAAAPRPTNLGTGFTNLTPAPPPPGKKRGAGRRAAGLLAVGAIVAVKVGVAIMFSAHAHSGAAGDNGAATHYAGVAGSGVAYRSPAGRFEATFPATPEVTIKDQQLGTAGTRPVTFTRFRSPDPYFGVMYFDFVGASEFSVRGVANDWVPPSDATDVAVGTSTILGINARYATFQENGFSFRALYFASGTRFYVLEVGASSPSGEGLERFRDSFRLTDTPY